MWRRRSEAPQGGASAGAAGSHTASSKGHLEGRRDRQPANISTYTHQVKTAHTVVYCNVLILAREKFPIFAIKGPTVKINTCKIFVVDPHNRHM